MKRKNNPKYETCVFCKKQLDIPAATPIDERKYYIQGAGQLCKECYDKIYHSTAKKN